MNNLQTIREKVIAAVSEIMELKFGCEVLHIPNNVKYVLISGPSPTYPTKNLWLASNGARDEVAHGETAIKTEDCEILGRPIRLADVLVAIVANYYGYLYFTVSASGRIKDGEVTGPVWNLREDDLSKQSEETLKFLAELLK